MATEEELNNQENLNREKARSNNLDSTANQFAQEAAKASQARVDYARSLTEELKDQLNIRSKNNETDKAQLSLSRQVAASAAENNVLLGNSQQIGRQILKDEKLLSNITREKEGLIASIGGANSEAYKIAIKAAELQRDQYTQLGKVEELQSKLLTAKGKEKVELDRRLKKELKTSESLDAQLANKVKEAEATGKLGKKEIDRLSVLSLMKDNQEKILEGREAEADIQKKINTRMGVTGAIVTGIGGIMQRLGMRSGIFNDAMEEAQQAMHGMAEETVRGEKKFNRLQIAAAGFLKISKGFRKALFDPLTIVTSIFTSFLDVNKATVEFQNLTGQAAVGIAGMNNRLASTVDYLEQAAVLTKLTGRNANNAFTSRTIATAAELQNTMGLTADEAGKLGVISATNTGYLDDQVEAIVDTTSAFNKANRTAVSQGQILRDVANTSDSIKLSLGNNPGAIAAAASAARRLGMELSQVDKIADSLMDFESSIQNELEAQLLTGRQLNLGKARELALNNDLLGLGKELFNNSVDINEYGKMNRIQQQSMAKALGMTKDELGRIAYLRAIDNNMTAEQAELAANVTKSDMERMNVQDQMKKAMDKLAQAAAPVLEIVAGIVDVLTPFITIAAKGIAFLVRGFEGIGTALSAVGKELRPIFNTFIDGIGPSAEAFVKLVIRGFKSIGRIADEARTSFIYVKDTIKEFAKPLKDSFSIIGNQLKPIFNYIDKKTARVQSVFRSIGDSIKDGMTQIKSFVDPMLEKLKPLTDGFSKLFASIGGLFGGVKDGEKSLANIGSILGDLGKIAGVGIIASKVYKGIKARRAPKGTSSDPINVIMAGGGMSDMLGDVLGKKGKKGNLLSKIFGKKFKGGQFMGKGLRAAAGGQRGPGMLSKLMPKGGAGGLLKMGPKLMKGSGILAAVGAVTDLVGNVSAAAKNPEKGVGDAIARTLDQNKFMALGAAIGSIVPGVGTLVGAGIGGLMDFASSQMLGEKGMITDSLESPPKLAAGGIVTQATTAVVGEAGPEAVIPLREFYAKMDELINVVKQGGDVYIDGNKAGQSLMLASTKLS